MHNINWHEVRKRLEPENNPTQATFRQIAAMLGPGWQGTKIQPDQKQEAREQFLNLWDSEKFGEPPPFLVAEQNPNWVDRKAKLFEIGAYHDKNLNVEEADLQRLEKQFSEPVQILIEHTENPLQLGYLTQVEAIGRELFGTLSLTEQADKLIESSQAKSLSLSVSRDLNQIFEVSIVSNPRVESAQLFCEDFRALKPIEKREKFSLDSYLREGKLLPSQKEAAEKLAIEANKVGLLEPLVLFFESLPSRSLGIELAPTGASTSPFSHEETKFYQEHFPGVPLTEIEQRRLK